MPYAVVVQVDQSPAGTRLLHQVFRIQAEQGEIMAKKLKLSAAAVLLLIVVPLCMYTCALLVGVQLGRALERAGPPDSFVGAVRFSMRGALEYVTKEIWDINVMGRRRGGSRENRHWVPVEVASRARGVDRLSTYEPYVALPDLASANDVVKRKSNTNYTTSSTKRYYNHTSPRGVISVGPWGGSSGGQPFYMDATSAPRLRSIVIYHSGAIHSLACEYTLAGDYQADDGTVMALRRRVAGPWGRPQSFGSRGLRAQIELRPGEHITAMEGTTGHFRDVPGVVITSLTFRTSTGRMYGPYGSVAAAGSHHHFSVPAADGGCIAGFWGRSGWLLDAIGVYVKPSCSSSSSSSSSSHTAAAAAYRMKYYASRRTREDPIVENN